MCHFVSELGCQRYPKIAVCSDCLAAGVVQHWCSTSADYFHLRNYWHGAFWQCNSLGGVK